MSITGIGLMLVFISDILDDCIQTIRLETSPIDAIQTILEIFGFQNDSNNNPSWNLVCNG